MDQTDGVEEMYERNGLSPDRVQNKENRIAVAENYLPSLDRERVRATRKLGPMDVMVHAHWASQTLREKQVESCPISILLSHIRSISLKVKIWGKIWLIFDLASTLRIDLGKSTSAISLTRAGTALILNSAPLFCGGKRIEIHVFFATMLGGLYAPKQPQGPTFVNKWWMVRDYRWAYHCKRNGVFTCLKMKNLYSKIWGRAPSISAREH